MNDSLPPPRGLLPALQKLKNGYIRWFEYYTSIPKTHRYTLGSRIDALLVETIEAVATAGFLVRSEKIPYVRVAIRKLDTTKVLLMVLWETKSLDNKKYITLSEELNEVGRQLGGWHGQLVKQNSLENASREK